MQIALVGDIALYGKYSIDNENIFNYFCDVASILKRYDYVIGNLETPLCSSIKPYGFKSAFIKASEENVSLLKFLNINVVNLANNHIFDYGLNGYQNTKNVLDKNQIQYFGIENKQLKLTDTYNKIVLSGYCCYSTNGVGYYNPETQIGVNILNAFLVEKILIANHLEGYLNICSFHIGEEHVNYPNYDHVEMARKFSSKLPYVFYGHHPHVIQGIEEINQSLLAYSLGNFCFDDVYTKKSNKPLIEQSEQNKKSFILCLDIEKNVIINYKLIPLYAGKDKMIVGENQSFFEEIKVYSDFLNEKKGIYNQTRNSLINEYIKSRKMKRNFQWYMKRLNINSVGIILNSIKNKNKYKKFVLDYINRSESH